MLPELPAVAVRRALTRVSARALPRRAAPGESTRLRASYCLSIRRKGVLQLPGTFRAVANAQYSSATKCRPFRPI
jgi:hypothetical protein